MSAMFRRLAPLPRLPTLFNRGARCHVRYPAAQPHTLSASREPHSLPFTHSLVTTSPPLRSQLPTPDIFIWSFITLNTFILYAWSEARANASKNRAFLHLHPVKRDPSSTITLTSISQQDMLDNFTLSERNLAAGRWWTALTMAVSHQDKWHYLMNMIAFYFYSRVGFVVGLSLPQMCSLSVGSALASSVALIWDHRTRKKLWGVAVMGFGLGASGLVQGLSVAVSLIVPQRLLLGTLLYIYVDMVSLRGQREGKVVRAANGNFVGHSGHLGGGAFGALFYYLVLRPEFKGIRGMGL